MAHFTCLSCCTGVSTAFAAPIGGLLLAIEEGSSFLNLGIFWRGFLATCSGVLTLHFLAQLHEDFDNILEAKLGIRRDLGWAFGLQVYNQWFSEAYCSRSLQPSAKLRFQKSCWNRPIALSDHICCARFANEGSSHYCSLYDDIIAHFRLFAVILHWNSRSGHTVCTASSGTRVFASHTVGVQSYNLCRLYDDNVALYGKRYYYYIWELPLFCLIGIIAGLVGAAFVRLYVICSRLRAKYIPASNPYRRLAEVSIAFSKSWRRSCLEKQPDSLLGLTPAIDPLTDVCLAGLGLSMSSASNAVW